VLNHLYDPNRLLSALSEHLQIASDKKLAKMLGFSAGIIAGLRAGRLAITPTMYLQLQEKTGLPVDALRALSGDRRQRHRPTGARLREPTGGHH
jgi:plasmid maintenance system antidote protein VapI